MYIQWLRMALCAMALATTSALASTVTVPGNVAGWVKQATPAGAAAASARVEVAVELTLKDAAGLKALVAAVSKPHGAEYGHYLSGKDFAARFAPAAADVAAVKSLLEHAGMLEVRVGPFGAYVTASATVAQVAKTFDVDQMLYHYHGKTLRANSRAPSIPAALAGKVLFIGGLDDSGLLRKPMHASTTLHALAAPASASSGVTPPPVSDNNPSAYCNTDFGASALVATLSVAADVYGASIPWLNCGYTPQQIRAAYGVNRVHYDGTGVTVAITDAYASPTLLADANRYSKNHALPALVEGVNFNQIIPEGIYDVSPNEPCQPYGWWIESSIDIDAVHGVAPGANVLFVGSRDCNTSLDIAWQNVLYSHLADVVTDSWNQGGEALPPGAQASDDQAAMAGAAQGMTVLFSSGDDGDLAEINGLASGSWPVTSPYVTGVGGTSLFITDSKSGAKQEYGWGGYYDFFNNFVVKSATSVEDKGGLQTTTAFGVTFDNFAFFAGSGGGISLLESQPAWQVADVPANLAVTLNLASGYSETLPNPMRVSPEIAAVADPYTGYLIGETFTIAGNAIEDAGCTPITSTEEYCEITYGGTSLASPVTAGILAVANQAREQSGEPVLGFVNPLLYSLGSRGNGVELESHALSQIIAPTQPVSVLQSFVADLSTPKELTGLLITINSAPLNILTAPYALEVCGLAICEGLDDIFNYTSLSSAAVPPTPAGYNDVVGLGVPWAPDLIQEAK